MDDTVAKLIAAVIVLAAVVVDWPRALAGLAVGYFGRRSGYALIVIPVGVLAVALLGEVIYPLIGWTQGASMMSFFTGLVSAGATAYGLFRWFGELTQA